MESYELNPDVIINWALDFADYEELEKTAKSLYSIYVQRRKNEYPDEQKKNRKIRRQLTSTGEYAKPKMTKSQKRKLRAQRQMASNAKRFL